MKEGEEYGCVGGRIMGVGLQVEEFVKGNGYSAFMIQEAK